MKMKNMDPGMIPEILEGLAFSKCAKESLLHILEDCTEYEKSCVLAFLKSGELPTFKDYLATFTNDFLVRDLIDFVADRPDGWKVLEHWAIAVAERIRDPQLKQELEEKLFEMPKRRN